MTKGKEKKEENYNKKGGKGLKNASFWAIHSKKNRFAPPTATLFAEGKKNFQWRKGGGEIIEMHNICPWLMVETIFTFFFLNFPPSGREQICVEPRPGNLPFSHELFHAKWIIHIPVPISTQYLHLFLSLTLSLFLSLSACYPSHSLPLSVWGMDGETKDSVSVWFKR